MAKLRREASLRERRIEKAARKQIRKQTQSDPAQNAEPDLMASDAEFDLTASNAELGLTASNAASELMASDSAANAPVPRSASDASPSPPAE